MRLQKQRGKLEYTCRWQASATDLLAWLIWTWDRMSKKMSRAELSIRNQLWFLVTPFTPFISLFFSNADHSFIKDVKDWLPKAQLFLGGALMILIYLIQSKTSIRRIWSYSIGTGNNIKSYLWSKVIYPSFRSQEWRDHISHSVFLTTEAIFVGQMDQMDRWFIWGRSIQLGEQR